MICRGRISPQVAAKLLLHFDRAFIEGVRLRIREAVRLEGRLLFYRSNEGIFTFELKEMTIKDWYTQEIIFTSPVRIEAHPAPIEPAAKGVSTKK